jgi:hypothetical protein
MAADSRYNVEGRVARRHHVAAEERHARIGTRWLAPRR